MADWIRRAASFSGTRSDIHSDRSTKDRKKFFTLSLLKRSKSQHSRLSTDSTLIGESVPDFNQQLKENSTFADNPFQTVSDYRKAAQQSQDSKFRFQFAMFLIDAANETNSKFFMDEARQWLEILAYPLLFKTKLETAAETSTEAKIETKAKEEITTETQKEIKEETIVKEEEQGYVTAQYILANWYMSGSFSVKKDEAKAFDLYKRASLQNHPQSTYLLAKCYQDGLGTEKNDEYARKEYQKASKLGDSRASFVLGHAFVYGGIGLESNPHLFINGIELLKQCITDKEGEFFLDALYELYILFSGSKSTKSSLYDPIFSQSCLTIAANLDHVLSQYQLGYSYEHGLLNLPIDPYQSIFWYSKAASFGNADACLGLSGWYLTGAAGILPKSLQDAYLWAHKSADKGSSRGFFAVGYFLEYGIGVQKNKSKAKKWYKKSASMGEKKAIARLDELKSQRGLFPSKRI